MPKKNEKKSKHLYFFNFQLDSILNFREIAREQEKQQKRIEMQKEMQEYLKTFKEKQSKIKEYEKEVERFEMLNRNKQLEVLKDYEKIKNERNKEKTAAYRQELLEQIEDDRKQIEQEREVEMNFVDTQYDEDDQEFFAYAKEVTETLKNKGLEVFPVERVVEVFIYYYSSQFFVFIIFFFKH